MKTLSTFYDKEATNCLHSNGGNMITLKQVANIFGLAYIKAVFMLRAINAFKKTGIFPLIPNAFINVNVIVSETTNVVKSYNDLENCK